MIFCAYWVISSIGIFDFDTDVDIDLDMDADADVSIDGGIFSSILNFVNAADVPVMLVLTLLNVSMWVISMISNEQWNPDASLGIAALFFILNFIISVVVTKFLTKPLAPLFNAIKTDVEAATPLIGQSGKVKSRILDHHYGQVEVARDKNAPALLNCKLSDSDAAMVRGEEVLIVKYDKESKRYIVRSLAFNQKENSTSNSPNNEQITQTQTENLTTSE